MKTDSAELLDACPGFFREPVGQRAKEGIGGMFDSDDGDLAGDGIPEQRRDDAGGRKMSECGDVLPGIGAGECFEGDAFDAVAGKFQVGPIAEEEDGDAGCDQGLRQGHGRDGWNQHVAHDAEHGTLVLCGAGERGVFSLGGGESGAQQGPAKDIGCHSGVNLEVFFGDDLPGGCENGLMRRQDDAQCRFAGGRQIGD